jgi:hypothetical protein
VVQLVSKKHRLTELHVTCEVVGYKTPIQFEVIPVNSIWIVDILQKLDWFWKTSSIIKPGHNKNIFFQKNCHF